MTTIGKKDMYSFNSEKDKEDKLKCTCFPTRFAVILTAFFAYNFAYLLRANLSVALVKMVGSSKSANQTATEECKYSDDYANRSIGITQNQQGEFHWSETEQGVLLSSFVFTFGIGGLIGGRLAEKLGTKKIIGWSILTLSVLTILTPLAAWLSLYVLILVRLVEGYMAGMVMPTMNTVVSRWMPKSERSIGCSLLLGGTRFGNVLGSLLTGFLCKSPLLDGWPLTFYVFGGLGVLWTVVWYFVMAETPSEHPRISNKEKTYILLNQGNETAKKNVPIPYKMVLTSIPVWATVFANIGESWGTATLPINLPLYFAYILQYDVAMAGLLSAMPPLVQTVTMWCSGLIADCILRSGRLTRTQLRKTMNSLGLLVPACCLLATSFVGCNRVANVVLLTLTLGINGFVAAGFRPSLIDMAPDFAGTLMGLTVFLGNSVAFISPFVVGYLTNHKQTMGQWQIVFWINAAFYTMGGLCFLFGGSAELQPWGLAKVEDTKSEGQNNPTVQDDHL